MNVRNRKLLLIGGGGHCKSVLDTVLSLGLYDDIGIVDIKDTVVLGVSVVGSDHDLFSLFQGGWTDAFVTVGSIGNTGLRRKLFETIKQIGFHIPSFIDNTAATAGDVQIDEHQMERTKAIILSMTRKESF